MSRAKKHRKKKRNLNFIPIIFIFLLLCIVITAVYFKFKGKNISSLNPASTSTNGTAAINNSENANNSADNSENNTQNNTQNSTNKTETANNTSNIQNSASANTTKNTVNKTTQNTTNTNSSAQSTSVDDSSGNAVSVTKAKTILDSKINNGTVTINTNYDHLQSRDNQKYYVFRASDTSNNSQGSDTSGWYYVNVNTGEAYSWDLIDDKLELIK